MFFDQLLPQKRHLQTFKLEKNDRQAGYKVGMIWPGKANFSGKALTLPAKQYHFG